MRSARFALWAVVCLTAMCTLPPAGAAAPAAPPRPAPSTYPGPAGAPARLPSGVWLQVASPVTGTLSDVTLAPDGSGWAVGGGAILRWDGTAWTASAAAAVTAVDAPANDNAWAVSGECGATPGVCTSTIMHWDGMQWGLILAPYNVALYDVDLLSPGMGFAVGGWCPGPAITDCEARIAQWDGMSWATVPAPGPLLQAVSVHASDDAWAVGARWIPSPWGGWQGVILHWNGNAWGEVYSGDGVIPRAVTSVSERDAWVVGERLSLGMAVLHWDGTAWTQYVGYPPPAFHGLAGIALATPSDGWAAGDDGTIVHWDGTAWSLAASPVQSALYAAAMSSPDSGWIVGEGGTILRYRAMPFGVATPLVMRQAGTRLRR